MEKVIMLRYGEMHLKGANRGFFEKLLIDNLKTATADFKCKIKKIMGRYVVSDFDDNSLTALVANLRKVFGLHSLSVAEKTPTNAENILNFCRKLPINHQTFKIVIKRADKTFPIKSMDFAKLCGAAVLETHPELKVDVYSPQLEIKIDIREDGNTYISSEDIPCAGGLPIGSSGQGLLLLSGGIDSPVAGWFMARRGMKVHALHFHSFPYTSAKARDKVERLARQMGEYLEDFDLHIISITKVQEEINKNCDHDFMIILMRRIMMRIAENLAKELGAGAIITGENLAQVASQTLESLTVTNAVVDIPIFRPLIGLDKLDIIEVAKKIDTYDISILPYEDCCTVFLPKNPVTRPRLNKVLEQEEKLNIDELVAHSLSTHEVVKISKN